MRFYLIIALLCVCVVSRAITINAASGSAGDVQNAIYFASAGDTVVIPAGTNHWTNGISWTAPANVTLMGSGTSNTGGDDKTVIIDDYAVNYPLLLLSANTNGVFRMSGITFKTGTGEIKDGGLISLSGGMSRIDHCHFLTTNANTYKIINVGVYGVLDHCILDLYGTDELTIGNGGGTDGVGNQIWSEPTAFGSTNFFFIEDNIINGSPFTGDTVYSSCVSDNHTGSRMVIRFNTLTACVLYQIHATGHSTDDRGARAIEAYGNAVTSPLLLDPNFVMADCSSGCQLVWGNSADQVYKGMFQFYVVRKDDATYPQQPTPTGWGYAGTNFNGTGSMWDGGTALGNDLQYGYPCIDQPGRGQGDLLSGNVNGQGVFPNKTNMVTGTIYWPHQALEPIYIWANNGTNVNGWRNYYNADVRVVANRDYYPQASGIQTSPTSPFDGTSGTGWGTLANRPTTCTPGVAYFATDQGSWNTSSSNPYGVQQNGASGVLYKATATNTWTLYYTPQTYPHLLNIQSAYFIVPWHRGTN